MKKSPVIFILCLFAGMPWCFSQTVEIRYDGSSPQQRYAAGMLGKSLGIKGYTLKSAGADYTIHLAIGQLQKEAYSVLTKGNTIYYNRR